ncbi:unnamed protein product [Parajaminaea phylloscopi]
MFATRISSLLGDWTLPSLSSYVGLSTTLQRRVAAFLLRRILGKLVKPGQLDWNQVEAGLTEGTLEIRDVELSTDAINAYLVDLPIHVASMKLGTVSVRLPLTSMWSGSITVTIVKPQAEIQLKAATARAQPQKRAAHTTSDFSLSDSLADAAQVFRQENNVLDGSAAETPATGTPMHSSTARSADAAAPESYFTAAVESLLTRLSVHVQDFSVLWTEPSGFQRSSVSLFELSIDEIRYRTDVQDVDPSDAGAQTPSIWRRKTRCIEVHGLDLWSFAADFAIPARHAQELSRKRSTSLSSDCSSGLGEDSDDMMRMSQAVQDLSFSKASVASRYCDATSTAGSVYQSIVEEEAVSPPTRPRMAADPPRTLRHKILQLSDVPTIIELTTDKPVISSAVPLSDNGSQESPGPSPQDKTASGGGVKVKVKAVLGALNCFVTGGDVQALICVLAQIEKARGDADKTTRTDASYDAVEAADGVGISASITVRSLHLACAYESSAALSHPQFEALTRSLDGFWRRQGQVQPCIGHVRLDLGHLNIQYTLNGPSAASAEVSVGRLDLMEHTPKAQSTSVAVFPIIVLDHNLTRYAVGFANEDPGVSLTDWKRPDLKKGLPFIRTSLGDNAWHLRPVEAQQSGGHDASVPSPAIGTAATVLSIRASIPGKGRPDLQLITAPIHIFADVSVAERLMPLLHVLAATHSVQRSSLSSPGDSLTSSVETINAGPLAAQSTPEQPIVSVEIPLIRCNLRVPPSMLSHRDGGSSAPVSPRSGLLCADLHRLTFSNETKSPPLQSGRYTRRVHYETSAAEHEQAIEWVADLEQLKVYLQPAQSQAAKLIVHTASLADFNDADLGLRPRIACMRTGTGPSLKFSLPLLSASLSKVHLDSLQLLADDASNMAARLSQIGASSADERDGLKILGSRFFGSRAGLSLLSASDASAGTIHDPAQDASGQTRFAVEITEFVLELAVPREVGLSSQLVLTAQEGRIAFDPAHDKDTAKLDLSVLAFRLRDQSKEAVGSLIEPTLPHPLTGAITPMFSLKMWLFADKNSSHRESRVEPALQNCTVTMSEDHALFADLGQCLRAPEGVFEDVEPNEMTRLRVQLKDISLVLSPRTHESRAVVVLDSVTLRSRLLSASPRSTLQIDVGNATCLLNDSADQSPLKPGGRIRSAVAHWSTQGFVKIVQLYELASIVTTSKLTLPDLDVAVTKVRAELLCCADTLAVLPPLISNLFPTPTSGVATATALADPQLWDEGSYSSSGDSTNLLQSLDDQAFKESDATSSIPDMLEDDVPSRPEFFGATETEHTYTQVDYLETDLGENEFFGNESVASVIETGPTHSRGPGAKTSDSIISTSDVCTIRLLDPAGVQPALGYFSRPDIAPVSSNPIRDRASTFRFSVEDCNVSLKLFGGYDWAATRREIEDEIKKVRRRLQKIKQMLDEGQRPDDSVEDATEDLMQSVHFSLEPEADATAALHALNDALEAQSETASSASTWQPLPHGHSAQTGHATANAHRRRRSRLERSYQSQIDIEFRGLSVRYNKLTPGAGLISSIDAGVRSVQILDNISTSTWHAFLTEMVTAQRRLEHESNHKPNMVHVQLLGVPGSNARAKQGGAPSQELRLRAKIAPLRLHVDQDALDFLKKFFAFQRPGEAATRKQSPATQVGDAEGAPYAAYIQYAEVLPIKLKLDYKPKRVDYNLLRQGRTIEMMNFFHFDAAEMTLRHVKLRGISGWPRLFDSLNDIWTPDVKANQLADVLSGIAPVRSLVNVGSGVADLILLPIEQYQKDGRLAKGLQKGAKRFAKATALEAVRLGARLATGTQVILEKAEHVFGGSIDTGSTEEAVFPTPSRSRVPGPHATRAAQADWTEDGGLLSTIIDGSDETHSGESGSSSGAVPPGMFSKYAEQPDSLREALSQAYSGLTRGVSSAAQTILAVPMEVYEGGGADGSGGRTVVRAVPIAVMQGAKGASEAVSKTLMGLQGALEGRHGQQQWSSQRRDDGRGGPFGPDSGAQSGSPARGGAHASLGHASGSSTPRAANTGMADKYKKRPGPSGTR